LSTSTPKISSWPSYRAVDYSKPGHPRLTSNEALRLHSILKRVKPCQQSLVRYAFPNDKLESFGAGTPEAFVTFFESHKIRVESSGDTFIHVLGAANAYYSPSDGKMAFGPFGVDDPDSEPQRKLGIEWDMQHESCSGEWVSARR
jgi:hypothetical protein